MLKKKDGTIDWSANIQWTIIIGLVILGIFRLLNRPDRELTPQEKSENIDICHKYYGNGQEYQDCINDNYNQNE